MRELTCAAVWSPPVVTAVFISETEAMFWDGRFAEKTPVFVSLSSVEEVDPETRGGDMEALTSLERLEEPLLTPPSPGGRWFTVPGQRLCGKRNVRERNRVKI